MRKSFDRIRSKLFERLFRGTTSRRIWCWGREEELKWGIARISAISYQSLARVMRMVNESRSAHRADPGTSPVNDPASLEELLHLLGRSIHGYLWTGAPVGGTGRAPMMDAGLLDPEVLDTDGRPTTDAP